MLTRRDTARLLLAGAALPLLPTPALARSESAWAKDFSRQLAQHIVSGCDGDLTLMAFGMRRQGSTVRMGSIIQLTRTQGIRRRRFDATGAGEEETFNTLLNQSLLSFAKAWPGCVV